MPRDTRNRLGRPVTVIVDVRTRRPLLTGSRHVRGRVDRTESEQNVNNKEPCTHPRRPSVSHRTRRQLEETPTNSYDPVPQDLSDPEPRTKISPTHPRLSVLGEPSPTVLTSVYLVLPHTNPLGLPEPEVYGPSPL